MAGQYSQLDNFQFAAMKHILNTSEPREQHTEEHLDSKKLHALMSLNKDRQSQIYGLEKELQALKEDNTHLASEIEQCETQLKQLEEPDEQEKSNGEQEEEMDNWLNAVQKYNGLAQERIDELISIEYEGGPEQEICLACYVELQVGAKCKYLPCCHLFHAECVNNHLKINKLCPACQEEVI